MTTDVSSSKRVSVLQAVAQGYCPMVQEDAEQETSKGNQNSESDATCCSRNASEMQHWMWRVLS